MKKNIFIVIIIVISFIFSNNLTNANNSIKNDISNKIDNYLNKKTNNINLKQKILLNIRKQIIKNNSVNTQMILNILNEKIKKINNEIYEKENKINEVILWYSEWWLAIKWYYKWNLDKPFTWFFWDIHWGYEYWTYQTLNYFLDYLKNSNSKQWFIIPTLNPDWLKIAQIDKFKEKFYLEWRSNINNIDINRNFCTSDYKKWNYIKKKDNKSILISFWDKCWLTSVSNIIDNIFLTYSFKNIIDIHSEWWIIFIPNKTIDNLDIISLWNNIVDNIWRENYDFNPSYNNILEKKKKVEKYEIGEWGKNLYNWLMIQYIYEKYWVNSVILELKKHWEIEYNIINLEKIL